MVKGKFGLILLFGLKARRVRLAQARSPCKHGLEKKIHVKGALKVGPDIGKEQVFKI